MIKIILWALSLSLLSAGLATAAIYKHVDKNGNVTYTDTPDASENSKPVDLPPINQQPPTPIPPPPPVDTNNARPNQSYQLAIISPRNNTHLNAGQRDLEITVSVAPPMPEGLKLQALLNGKPYGPASTSASWILENIYRGEHQLSVQLLNASGQVIKTSRSVTITAFRPSVGGG